jgi:HSP20 family protein
MKEKFPSTHRFLPREIEKLFDEIIHHPWGGGGFHPTIDLLETEEAYIITGDFPGLQIDHINIYFDQNEMVIAGDRFEEKEHSLERKMIHERKYGKFFRRIALPSDADMENPSAEITNGVLRVTLEKKKKQ